MIKYVTTNVTKSYDQLKMTKAIETINKEKYKGYKFRLVFHLYIVYTIRNLGLPN